MMTTNPALEKCVSYIQSCADPSFRHDKTPKSRLAITLSRETGTGGLVIAHQVAERLEQDPVLRSARPWAVLDKEIVAEVLQRFQLPGELARYMPEDRVSELEDIVEESLGLHPSARSLVRATTHTILQLAELGNVILVGRGAHRVTAQLPHVFHVRLIGSIEHRTRRLARFDGIDEGAAREIIRRTDRGRARYLKKYFGCEIDDARLYDVVFNTDRLSDELVARTIVELARSTCSGER